MTAMEANASKGNAIIAGIGSMAAARATIAHDSPSDFVTAVSASLKQRLADYDAKGLAHNSARFASTSKAIAMLTVAPAPITPPAPVHTAPSRATKAELQAQLAELQAFVTALTAK
jgi:hypothetical protein